MLRVIGYYFLLYTVSFGIEFVYRTYCYPLTWYGFIFNMFGLQYHPLCKLLKNINMIMYNKYYVFIYNILVQTFEKIIQV